VLLGVVAQAKIRTMFFSARVWLAVDGGLGVVQMSRLLPRLVS